MVGEDGVNKPLVVVNVGSGGEADRTTMEQASGKCGGEGYSRRALAMVRVTGVGGGFALV